MMSRDPVDDGKVVLFASEWVFGAQWLDALRAAMPAVEFRVHPQVGDPAHITSAVVWKIPEGALAPLDALRLVLPMGAGVDEVMDVVRGLDPGRARQIQVARLVDPVMAEKMAEYVLARVLHYHRGFDVLERAQRSRIWHQNQSREAKDYRVGILGMGYLGQACARALLPFGYDVSGWSRREKSVPGVRCVAGRAHLSAFLRGLDCVVCLLPLTPQTRGMVNGDMFDALPEGVCLINVARGGLVNDGDLLEALDRGKVRAATLDVFREEPLREQHAYWTHPGVFVTPHISSISNVSTGVEQIAANLRRFWRGHALHHVVDRQAGY